VTGRALYVVWPPERFGIKLSPFSDDDYDNDDDD
ncbi:unnamed protein product, partial [Rotaria magnacalcarata]